jgi:hypothetical protein
MMRKFLLLMILLFSQTVFAENGCPDGMQPFQNQGEPVATCQPIPGYAGNQGPVQPQGHWVSRWGGIAVDKNNGFFGVANNFANKRLAKKSALSKCKANGGKECEFKLAYYNQCAVIAWGDSSYFVQSKETIEAAAMLALPKCNESTSNCKIVYSGCSPPEWIQ